MRLYSAGHCPWRADEQTPLAIVCASAALTPAFHRNHDSMKVTNGLARLWTPINVCDNDSRYMALGAGVADAACVAQELCRYV